MHYYPIFLDLTRKKVVIVGGGRVAERKFRSLARTGASITVVSPSMTRGLLRAKDTLSFRHIPRSYRKGDLRNAVLVIAATDSDETNLKIARETAGLVNVIDNPKACSFIVPSVIMRGPLCIAVSTSGISPALSKTIRKELEYLYGPDFGAYLRLIKKLRDKTMQEVRPGAKRAQNLKRLGSHKMIQQLRTKGFSTVKKTLLCAKRPKSL